MTNWLIKGGTVVDGTGAPRRAADVRIVNGRIAEIGPDLDGQGEPVLDASDAFVTPGFIDSHTHLDGTLFWDPMCDPMPQHGVTTVAIGNCSLGFAPVRAIERDRQADVFSYIEDIPLKVLQSSIPWAWETFDEYLAALSDRSFGVNVAVLIGHSQIRSYIMGEDAWTRTAGGREIAAMAVLLDRALAAGAFGMSFSLFDKDRDGRRVPSHYADDAEMDALFAILSARGGVFQMVPCTDTMDTIHQNLEWIGGYLARYGVTGLYNLVMDREHDSAYSQRLLGWLADLHAKGARMYGMVTPRPFENAVGFDQTIAFMAIPAWNEIIQADREGKHRLLLDPDWRARARQDFDNSHSVLFPVWRLDLIRITTVSQPALEPWVGRTLQSLVEARPGHPSDVLADWVVENAIDTALVCVVGNIDPARLAPLIDSPFTFISASDAGAHVQMFSGAGDTTLLLTRYVRDRQDLTLEKAIHKLTGHQAELLGIRDRGRLALGLAADVTIFALEELTYGAEVNLRDLPGGSPRFSRPPGCFRYTLVNGTIVQAFGKATGALPAGLLAAHHQGATAT